MKKIEVDCNFNYLGPSCPYMSIQEVHLRKLVNGQEVIAHQDNAEWIGQVFFDSELPYQYQWYIKILRLMP